MEERFLNEKQVAALTGLSLSTLQKMRHFCKGIPYLKIGKSVRYIEKDVREFMERHRVTVDALYDC